MYRGKYLNNESPLFNLSRIKLIGKLYITAVKKHLKIFFETAKIHHLMHTVKYLCNKSPLLNYDTKLTCFS